MIFYAITGLLNCVTAAILGLFVFLKDIKSKVNRTFALFSLTIVVWSYSYFFWQVSNNADDALFWSKALMFGAIFIPIAYLHFVLTWLNKIKEKKKILIFGYVFFFVCSLFSFSSLFVKDVRPRLGFNFWPTPGLIYHLFIVVWLFYAFYGLYLLWLKTKESTGIIRSQARYLFYGMSIGLLGGMTNYFLWYDIPIPPIGNILVVGYVGFTAYAILKYRLMDIRVAIKRGAIFSGLVAAVTSVYILAGYLLGWSLFGGAYTFQSQIITGLIVAVLTAIGFRPLYDWLKKTTDKFLFKGEYRPEVLMANTIDVLARSLDLNAIIRTLKEEIGSALRIEKMEVIILEEFGGSGEMSSTGSGDNKIQIKKIIECFNAQRESLVLEELKRKRLEGTETKECLPLIKEMENAGTALAIPLFIKEKLVGLFLLGAKKSEDILDSVNPLTILFPL